MGIITEIKSLFTGPPNVFLLQSIKSPYILKYILSFLYEKKKLNLIVYNKKFQIKLSINIDKYKAISGKIKEGERTGYGIEYKLGTTMQKLFEGEYLNGMRNGKGKEYDEIEKIKFKGEYLNGLKIQGKGYNEWGNVIFELNRNGKGKEYFSNGRIKFEGEYFNGKKWNGKGYNEKGDLEFIIKYEIGYAKEYNQNDKLIFKGDYSNGEKKWKRKRIL